MCRVPTDLETALLAKQATDMAEFRVIRNRLARFRSIVERLLVIEAILLGGTCSILWVIGQDQILLLFAVLGLLIPILGIPGLRLALRPEEDLPGTIRRLNAKKKYYRRKLGIRVRFSKRWFPFAERFDLHR